MPGAQPAGGRQHLFGDAIDRRAEDGELGLLNRGREIEKALVDGAEGTGSIERALPPADAEDAPGQAAPLGRQADRAADQADADDGKRL